MCGLVAVIPALLGFCVSDLVEGANGYGVFTPKKIELGSTPTMGSDAYASGFTLTAEKPFATLDYDYEVAGLPYFVVSSISNGPVDIEVKYAEQFPVLSTNFSDGPSQFASAVANSRRVETHRFTENEVGVTTVGPQASIEVIDDLSTLPGKFSSSNTKYNEIWNLGARAVSAACVDAGSQVPSWRSSEENGTFVPSSRPGVSYRTSDLADYELEFEAQIIRGGLGFYIGYDVAANRGSLLFHLSSDYPIDSTYTNINTTLFPANTVTFVYGFDFVNASTMTSYTLGNYVVPFDVKESVWYPIKVAVNSTAGNLVLWLDEQQVMNVTISDLGFTETQLSSQGYSTRGDGCIGFGGWQDQASLVRNVVATSLNDSSNVLYSNPMTNESAILPEFGVQTNTYGACLDGAKRDRYIWLGDFYHTIRIMGVANTKPEQVTGTWEYLFNYQAPNGQYPAMITMTYETPMPTPEVFLFDGMYLFPDYDILGLIGFVSYMEYFDDMDFARANWESLNKTVNWLIGCQGNDGLIDVTQYSAVCLGSGTGTAVNAAAVRCLVGMAKVAQAVGDEDSSNQWIKVADSIKTAINDLLWNDTLGNYAVDASTPEVYGVSATAFVITSGVANETQADLCVKSLKNIRQGAGYLDTSDTDNTTKISPDTNGFLLDALFQTGHTDEAGFLLDNLWDAMISNENYRSGASWEYVSQSLEPGLEEFTSLSHPWGGAPTYVLTNYVAGIRPEEFGFRRWIVNPLVTGLNVTSANATVNTPYGDLTAAWELIDTDTLSVTITAPVGTEDVFEVAQLNASTYQHSLQGTREPISFIAQL